MPLRLAKKIIESAQSYVFQDKVEGKFAGVWANGLKDSGLNTQDVTPALTDAWAVKDAGEVTHTKRAAFLAARVMKDFMVPKLEGGGLLVGV